MRRWSCLFAFVAAPVFATEHIAPANVLVTCNDHGAKVTFTDGSVVYLGKTCDAAIPGEGEGRWWYAASAFVFGVGSVSMRVSTELDCPVLPYCRP